MIFFLRMRRYLLACVQTSPISFVARFPRATKEIGDVCTQATTFMRHCISIGEQKHD